MNSMHLVEFNFLNFQRTTDSCWSQKAQHSDQLIFLNMAPPCSCMAPPCSSWLLDPGRLPLDPLNGIKSLGNVAIFGCFILS